MELAQTLVWLPGVSGNVGGNVSVDVSVDVSVNVSGNVGGRQGSSLLFRGRVKCRDGCLVGGGNVANSSAVAWRRPP